MHIAVVLNNEGKINRAAFNNFFAFRAETFLETSKVIQMFPDCPAASVKVLFILALEAQSEYPETAKV